MHRKINWLSNLKSVIPYLACLGHSIPHVTPHPHPTYFRKLNAPSRLDRCALHKSQWASNFNRWYCIIISLNSAFWDLSWFSSKFYWNSIAVLILRWQIQLRKEYKENNQQTSKKRDRDIGILWLSLCL